MTRTILADEEVEDILQGAAIPLESEGLNPLNSCTMEACHSKHLRIDQVIGATGIDLAYC